MLRTGRADRSAGLPPLASGYLSRPAAYPLKPPAAHPAMTVTTKVTELSDSRVRLDAEVPGAEVESRVQRAARQIGQELRIPGFRKGKVPAPMVIQRIGREAVLEQAVRDSLPEWYEEALMRSGVSSVGDPKLDVE